MIDIHSHILPGIDDGAKDIEETLEMLKIASENGIKKMVSTPHYYRGYYENNYRDICKLVERVNTKAKEKSINVEIFPGQEVFLDNYTLELYNSRVIRGINETSYMLVELPMESKPKDALNMLYELRIKGIKPIIAHPERYAYIIEKPSVINEFIDENCLFQINSGSITGMFGKQVQKVANKLIANNICSFIASDAHSPRRRCPEIKNALKAAEEISKDTRNTVVKNAEDMLNNLDVYTNYEKIKDKKSIFSFLKR